MAPRHHHVITELVGCFTHRSKDAISEWIQAEVPEAGRVTNRTGMGSSGWASSSRYDTGSAMSFFVKQVCQNYPFICKQ